MSKRLRECVYAYDSDNEKYKFPDYFYKALYDTMVMVAGEEVPWEISAEDDEMLYPIEGASRVMYHPLVYRLKDIRRALIGASKNGVMVWEEELLLFFVTSLERLAFPGKTSGRKDVRMGFGHEVLYAVCDLLLELRRSDSKEEGRINPPVIIETSDISTWLTGDCQSHEKLGLLQRELISLNKDPGLVDKWLEEL